MKAKLVGTQFAKAKAEGIKKGDKVSISHEPDNQYDKQALLVSYSGEKLGYIGKGTDLYDTPREQFPMEADVVDFLFKQDGDNYKQHEEGTLVALSLEIVGLLELKEEDNVKSFNEKDVVINFNEKEHVYSFGGKKLTGATTYIKKYIEPFDREMVSGNCERYWGIPRKKILEAWDLAGDLSSSFGTGVHKALEFEDLYRHYTKPKDGSRCFKIKHPIIRKIVNDFFSFYDTLGFEGEVIPEALVSDVELGLCGLADRILVTSWDKKTCRIQDYKVNHSFNVKREEKFNSLIPKELGFRGTKLNKLSLQLKFHQRMLEKSGWTVEGFDGFIYDDKWIHYSADTLDGFNILTGEYQK